MSSPHLWPARREFLRRGTPVAWVHPSHGAVTYGVMTTDTVWAQSDTANDGAGPMHPSCEAPSHIDLRDRTARAHAAWAWTRVAPAPDGKCSQRVLMEDAVDWTRLTDTGAAWRGFDYQHQKHKAQKAARVLSRMACGDATVTVAEANAALAVAEGAGWLR